MTTPRRPNNPNTNIIRRTYDEAIAAGITPKEMRNSINWFRTHVQSNVTRIQPFRSLESKSVKTMVEIGSLYYYQYDAKTKEKLKYWDSVPLVFIIEQYDDGFLGINLHYLPPKFRMILMDRLYDLSTNEKLNKRTKLKISYSILKGASRFQLFQPCLKRYLSSHVRSSFIKVDPQMWNSAIFLPIAKWNKATSAEVYADFRNKARR